MRYLYLSLSLIFAMSLAASEGVVLYEKHGYLGKSEVFYESDPDLRDNLIGNDRAGAIRIPQGCTVILYEHKNYKGRHFQLTRDMARLNRLGMGDRVSSIWIEWEEVRPGADGCVTLFSEKNYRGREEALTGDDPDLRNNRVRNDRISSILIPHGWTVILFEHKNYGGRSEILRGDDPDLSNNPIGLGRASSIQIKRSRGSHVQRSQPVTLYQHSNFRGRQEFLFEDDPDLGDNRIGNDSLSSIQIPHGVVVTLYEHVNFRGRSVELTDSVKDLKGFGVGNDAASSIRITRIRTRARR